MTQPLIAICVPSGDMLHADFAMSLATLCMNPGAPIFLVNVKSSLIPVGRNLCVETALKANATHVLFLDSDMTFPRDTVTRLLDHHKSIIGASYSQRVTPFHALGVTLDGIQKAPAPGLQLMQQIPTGCLLIETSVFKTLPRPWFNIVSEGEKLLGEDYYFCRQALKANLQVWCDGTLSQDIGHIGQKVYKSA